MGRFLILLGFFFAFIGVLILLKVPFSWLGKLPGDISLKIGKVHIYFPIATALLFSIIFSLLLSLFWRR